MSDKKCPVMHGATTSDEYGTTNKDWWLSQLNISILHQHDKKSDPMDEDLIIEKNLKIRLRRFKRSYQSHDGLTRLVASRLWALWSIFIRMTWHAAGTYRTSDAEVVVVLAQRCTPK